MSKVSWEEKGEHEDSSRSKQMKAHSETPLDNWGTPWACRGLPLQFAQKRKGDPTLRSGLGMPGQAGHTSEWPIIVRISWEFLISLALQRNLRAIAWLSSPSTPSPPYSSPTPQPDPVSQSQPTSQVSKHITRLCALEPAHLVQPPHGELPLFLPFFTPYLEEPVQIPNLRSGVPSWDSPVYCLSIEFWTHHFQGTLSLRNLSVAR